MEFRERLNTGGFLKLVEVLPPKGVGAEQFEKRLVPVKGKVDAVYIPSLQGGIMRVESWAAAKYLQDRGYETIFEVCCAHKNRVALQAEVLGGAFLGLRNVMVVAGDDPKLGDHPEAKAVFDVDVMGLLEGIRGLKKGYDMAGSDLEGAPDLCVGAKVDASAQGPLLELELRDMERKIRLGVEFFITTTVYDLEQLQRFMERAKEFKVPVIAGLMILKSAGMARYINKHVEGVLIPEGVIERLLKAPDKVEESARIAAEMIQGMREICQGVSLIPIGWEEKVPLVLEEAGL